MNHQERAIPLWRRFIAYFMAWVFFTVHTLTPAFAVPYHKDKEKEKETEGEGGGGVLVNLPHR